MNSIGQMKSLRLVQGISDGTRLPPIRKQILKNDVEHLLGYTWDRSSILPLPELTRTGNT